MSKRKPPVITEAEFTDPEESEDEVETSDEKTLRFGYTVGVNDDGSFVFDLHGEDKGIVQLLGLTRFAEYQIERMHNIALKQGDALTNQGLALLFQELQAIKQALGLPVDEES
jgi:hypothetical protein